MAELEQERAAVSEIEKCDQKALAEVKSSIADYAYVFTDMITFPKPHVSPGPS
jgi:hypothetical protein